MALPTKGQAGNINVLEEMSAHFAINSLLHKTHCFHHSKLEEAAAPSAPSIPGKNIEDIFAHDSSKQESSKQPSNTSPPLLQQLRALENTIRSDVLV